MSIPLANAPVSFGVWGPHSGPAGTSGTDVLGAVAAAGYAGAELGPPGYLGSPEQTAQAFADQGLQAAGVYVGLHLRAAPAGLRAPDRAGLEGVCRSILKIAHLALDAGAGQAKLPLGPIVLADEGTAELRDHPARDPRDRRLAMDDADWRSAAVTLRQAQDLIGDHGLATSFHPHLVTHVESRWEVERLLETTGVNITLDTGHLLLAGADPVACLRDWGERVDHVHLKDVRLDVLASARRAGAPRIDGWWGRACVPFGTGDVDLHGVVDALVARSYQGWIVVEQDHTPGPDDQLQALANAQGANRRWLETALARP